MGDASGTHLHKQTLNAAKDGGREASLVRWPGVDYGRYRWVFSCGAPYPHRSPVTRRGGHGKSAAAKLDVGLTDQTFTCAARAHVVTAARHAACLHLKCAMRGGVTPRKYR